jgi:iron complex outermembrane receptor protein
MKLRYMISCAALALLSGSAGVAFAADAPAADAPVATAADSGAAQATAATAAAGPAASSVGEVIVTAQRRNESIQKVPLTIQAFSGQDLSKLNITTFDDILKYTPNVTYGNNGPGQGSIFMRGLSAGFAGNQSSATISTFPNVALYLDDQSVTFPARNADIYLVDMERVEVLEGPQGTLFGGGAEAGAIRYITNKPNLTAFSGSAEAMYGATSGGGSNSGLNAVLNIPIIEDKLAVRAVIYDERRGGYIDNVPSTFTRSNNDIGNYYLGIHPTNGLCPNHLPAGSAGLCTTANPNQINNSSTAANDFNPVTYTGARFSALYEINNDWNVLITESFQNMEADGLFTEFPTGSDFQPLKALQVTSFTPSYDKDRYENTSWTLTGKIGPLKAIYTGGYMDRHISQQMDYTNYSRTGGGMYYQCTGGSTGWGTGAPTCFSPEAYWQDNVTSTHLTNEVRFSTPDDWRLRAIVGAYNEDFHIDDVMNFNYKSIQSCTPSALAAAQAGGPVCVANVRPAANSTTNDPSIRGDNTGFGEDTQRGYDQTAVFASVDFDIIPNKLTITGGTRWYQYNEFEVGSQYGTNTSCLNVPNGMCGSGVVNINAANDHVTYTGFKSRANLTYHVTPNTMLYYTFSQGFRPGGFNRSQKSVIDDASGAPQFKEPNAYAPDSLTNNEIGLKTELFNRRLMLNLSAYYMNWENAQILLYNPIEQINTTFGINGASYDVKGLEFQFAARPIDGLTIQGSGSYNDDTQSNSPCLVDNIAGTAAFGQCITQVKVSGGQVQSFANPFGTVGSTPAFSPKFQGNLRARYDWTFEEYHPYVQGGVSYTGSMFNQPATYPSGAGVVIPSTTYLRYEQAAYATFDAAIGVTRDRWSAQLFGTNLLDSHASTFTSSAQFIKAEVPLRPRVIGLKIGASF